jgi:phosphate transport system protein
MRNGSETYSDQREREEYIMLNDRIKTLNNSIIEYSTFVEYMLSKTIKAYNEKDTKTLKKVLIDDDMKANIFELDIDDLCVTTIAQFDPVAVDLRTILMILKINSDLERMGDHVVNIAESMIVILENNYSFDMSDVMEMVDITRNMLKECISAFINKDFELAYKVIEEDSKVDELRLKSIKNAIQNMKGLTDDKNLELELHVLRVTSNLERIGDLTTNICEDVVFITKGKIIKHSSLKINS